MGWPIGSVEEGVLDRTDSLINSNKVRVAGCAYTTSMIESMRGARI
jgi:hypothetical protein